MHLCEYMYHFSKHLRSRIPKSRCVRVSVLVRGWIILRYKSPCKVTFLKPGREKASGPSSCIFLSQPRDIRCLCLPCLLHNFSYFPHSLLWTYFCSRYQILDGAIMKYHVPVKYKRHEARPTAACGESASSISYSSFSKGGEGRLDRGLGKVFLSSLLWISCKQARIYRSRVIKLLLPQCKQVSATGTIAAEIGMCEVS
jgi:hypothetical protein